MNKRKPLPINPELKEYAVKMRKNMTDEEKKVWFQILKGRVPKFHRQRIIGNYIVDFFCPKLKLIIEIDGYQHFYKENKDIEEVGILLTMCVKHLKKELNLILNIGNS